MMCPVIQDNCGKNLKTIRNNGMHDINFFQAMGKFSKRQFDDIFLIFPRK